MAAGSSMFLFVNKTPDSAQLSQSGSSERQKIFSHVQSRSEAPKAYISSGRSIDTTTGSSRAPRPRGRPKKNKTTRDVPSKKSSKQSLPVYHPSPQTLGDGDGDPFDVQKAPISPRVEYILRIYSNDIIPILCPMESIASSSRHYTLSLAFEDPLVQHSLLSMVLTRLDSCSRHSRYRVLAMASKNEALKHLRNLLLKLEGERIHTSHCYAIALLIWIECLTGNPEEVKAHNLGLQYLLPLADDIESVHAYILRIIYACLYLCTAILDTPPAKQLPQDTSEFVLPEDAETTVKKLRRPDYSGPGHAFFLPQHSHILGPSLTPAAVKLQELVVLRKLVASGRFSKVVMQYVCLLEPAIEHELLSIRFKHKIDPYQDAVLLAMFIYSELPLIAAMGPSAVLSKTLAKQIRQALESTDLSTCWTPTNDLLLWVLIIGSFTCRGEDEGPWFGEQTYRALDHAGVQSWFDLRMRLAGFYDSRYLDGTIAAAWGEYDKFNTFSRFIDAPTIDRTFRELEL